MIITVTEGTCVTLIHKLCIRRPNVAEPNLVISTTVRVTPARGSTQAGNQQRLRSLVRARSRGGGTAACQ